MGQNNLRLCGLWQSGRRAPLLHPLPPSQFLLTETALSLLRGSAVLTKVSLYFITVKSTEQIFLSLSHVCGVCHSLTSCVLKIFLDFWRCSQLFLPASKAILRSLLCPWASSPASRNDLFVTVFPESSTYPLWRIFLPQECKPALSVPFWAAGAPVDGRACLQPLLPRLWCCRWLPGEHLCRSCSAAAQEFSSPNRTFCSTDLTAVYNEVKNVRELLSLRFPELC